MNTFVQQVASLPERERGEFVDNLSESELYALLYDWRYWARPEQLTPPGDWDIWLYLAGRGAGKTRTDAEDMKAYGLANAGSRMAIVAPTYSDARDTCVEGDSGLLKILPPDKLAAWNRSLGELILTNGTRYKLFSAEEPERLRGPQHHRAWCLAGDTPVLMANGCQKPLADIRVGEFVMTRCGPRRVTGHMLTKQNTQVYLLRIMDGRSIIGTAEHPVWVQGRGFVPMSLLSKGMSVCVTRVSSGTAIHGICGPARATTNAASSSIGLYGNKPMGRFQKGVISITKTVTKPITALRTWNSSRTVSTAPYTLMRRWERIGTRQGSTRKKRWNATTGYAWNVISSVLCVVRHTIAPPCILRAFALQHVSKLAVRVPSLVSCASVSSAQLSTMQQSVPNGTAHVNVIPAQVSSAQQPSSPDHSLVIGASPRSSQNDQTLASALINAPSLSTATIATVEKLAKRYDVYDIAVEGAHEFFANGILVHNCEELCAWSKLTETWDNLMFGLRLGRKPQVVISTTPKPSKFIKALMKRDNIYITRGSTFDNSANLAPAALAEFKNRYLGTRTGRQELFAEILEDVEGALWTREMVESSKVREVPEMKRIVVSVDPAVTSGESSDMTGIVVVGLGVDGLAYVLYSEGVRMSPDAWATRVVNLYYYYEADRVIAEVNQGGDLVTSVIHTVDRSIPVKVVRASRGKIVRAEPVAALWEQQRVKMLV